MQVRERAAAFWWAFLGDPLRISGGGVLPHLCPLQEDTQPSSPSSTALREQRCPAGDVWHPGHPPVPRSALPGSEQQQQLPNSITEIQRALCRTGATAARISGLPFSFSFSCKSEKPFWWSLLCCGCPRAIQKHNKKPTLRIPTTAFVHQSSCSQTPNRATNSSAPTAASSQAASRAAGGRSPQL